jgi:hypothetical protein
MSRYASSRRIVAIGILLAGFLLPSCGFKRKLVSITMIPSTATLTGPGVNIQFQAIGNYEHPPDHRDITNSVNWASAAPQIVTIDQAGLATSTTGCGTGITITATAHSDPHDSESGVVIGTATVAVAQPGGICP